MAGVISLIMIAVQSAEILEHLDGVSSWFFIYYLFLSFPTILIIVLAFVFPLGVYWTINYLRDDGEILAMQAVGVREKTILTWVFECGVFGALSIWILASVVEPIAINHMSKVFTEYSRKHFFSMLKPKTFNVKNANVLYANDVDANQHELKDIFMLQSKPNEWMLINSQSLHEALDGSVLFLKGEGLRFYIENDEIVKAEIASFDELSGDPHSLFNLKTSKSDEYIKPFSELWRSKHNESALARLCWMTGLPLMSMILVMMASNGMFIPPRAFARGRGIRFGCMLLIAILMLVFVQRQASDGLFNAFPEVVIIFPPILLALMVFWLGQFRLVRL